jgi:chromosome partitioning protein
MSKKLSCKIIAVVNQKGGCTKTATSMQLGGAFAEAGISTSIVDMDPQSTATLWSMQSRPGKAQFPAKVVSLGALKEQFLDKLGPLTEAYELLIIDCPPAVESNVPWASLLVADLAIIPVVPVMDNVWASKIAEDLVFKARGEREDNGSPGNLDAVFLLQQQRRGTVFEVCEEVLRNGARLPILSTKIALRNIYPESQLYGTHVTAMGKTPAANEINSFRDEVAKILGIKIAKVGKK